MKKYNGFINKVVNLVVYDDGNGIAEFISEDEKTITVHWITYNPCYDAQIYSEKQYTEPNTIEKEFICEISLCNEQLSKEQIENQRQSYKEYDAPVYARYEKLMREIKTEKINNC